MKAKLNLTIDEELIPVSKEYARSHGISVSQLVEELLREAMSDSRPLFSQKWRGKFKVTKKQDVRHEKLKKRFLS